MTLHLHGVVRATHALPTSGPGSQLKTLVWQDLAVAASELPAERALTDQDAVAHLDALCALLRDGPVLPLRFGTVVGDEDAVRAEMLAPTAPALRQSLDRIDGLVEVRVHVTFDEDAALLAVAEEQDLPPAAERGSRELADQIQLGQLIAQRLESWRSARAQALLKPAFELAHQAVQLGAPEHTAERWAFLVPQQRLAAVDEAVDALTAATEVTVTYLGPLPAYSFVDSPIQPEKAPPASRWGW